MICAKWAAAVFGSCRKRSAIQPAVKCVIDAVIAARRRGGVARDAVGGLRVAIVEQLAHQDAPLLPPLIEIDQSGRVLRHGEDQLAGFLRLVVFAQPLHARENVAGIVAGRGRHRVEQRLGVVQPLDHRGARAADRQFVAAEPVGGAHAGFDVVGVEALVHARLVVGAGEQAAEHSSTLLSASALQSS